MILTFAQETSTINLPTETTGKIVGFTSNFLSGLSPIIILVIAVVFGFWLFEVLIEIIGGLIETRYLKKDIKIVEQAGYQVIEADIPEAEVDEVKEAIKRLKRRGYKVIKE